MVVVWSGWLVNTSVRVTGSVVSRWRVLSAIQSVMIGDEVYR
jgi:hypothetical protein